jgi:hypothetical protein
MRGVLATNIVALALTSAALAQQPFDAPGLRFCAPPIKPGCVDAEETYTSPNLKAECQKAMDRYVPTVFAYRQCLNQEMERAVRQTNETIQRFRCRAKGERKCP